ncbi:MAG: hypothetical protein Q9226_004887 [Calogaya cf. arnoldii]
MSSPLNGNWDLKRVYHSYPSGNHGAFSGDYLLSHGPTSNGKQLLMYIDYSTTQSPFTYSGSIFLLPVISVPNWTQSGKVSKLEFSGKGTITEEGDVETRESILTVIRGSGKGEWCDIDGGGKLTLAVTVTEGETARGRCVFENMRHI